MALFLHYFRARRWIRREIITASSSLSSQRSVPCSLALLVGALTASCVDSPLWLLISAVAASLPAPIAESTESGGRVARGKCACDPRCRRIAVQLGRSGQTRSVERGDEQQGRRERSHCGHTERGRRVDSVRTDVCGADVETPWRLCAALLSLLLTLSRPGRQST